jgi:Alw26I/Eco31I/Esp3I family type II restriction endonuclease
MMKFCFHCKGQNLNLSNISANPQDYGSKGQTWAPEFVSYMKYIATHPIYAGMPDAVKDDGKIQWEAPSNRSSGQYQFTHNKRRDWWTRKAKTVGIDPTSDQWISRTAKAIHPTGMKPCKRCGKIMHIAYAYPQVRLINRFMKEFEDLSEYDPAMTITELLHHVRDIVGDQLLTHMRAIFKSKNIEVPDFNGFDDLLSWVENKYIPSEPGVLSPGAMSNAPDRFDGFHSFNRCCRSKADSGRSSSNLRSYSTDRRVFEFWSDGDWIAADRLMGLVRSRLRGEKCADGGDGPPSADHIGPISLGFCHRPEFRLLSQSANSAKNNRMSLQDVNDLLEREKSGIRVTSWYAEPLWNLRKNKIDTEEKARRLSKLLRDNQRNAMKMLSKLHELKRYSFLSYLLELGRSEFDVEFINLGAKAYVTAYSKIVHSSRTTKYANEQKARRLRIGFESLREYQERGNRHSFNVAEDDINAAVRKVNSILMVSDNDLQILDPQFYKVLDPTDGVIVEAELRVLVNKIPNRVFDDYETCKAILKDAMAKVATELSDSWEDDRYVREALE